MYVFRGCAQEDETAGELGVRILVVLVVVVVLD
jgi:hypothetical protein